MKKIYIMLFLITAIMTYTSCTSSVDDVFDKPSSKRIEETLENTNTILKSNKKGWIMKYYANPIYGGYNVFCKFNDDKTVTVSSEVYGEDEEYSSHYKLEQSQGAILSFDEYNPIFNFFSDPANPSGVGDNGKGMQGDFEFRVQSASNDSIVMLGKKNNSKIVMIPMPDNTEWSSYCTQVNDIDEKMYGKKYCLIVDGDSIMGSKSFNQLSFVDPEDESNIDMPFIVTTTGYELYKPYEFRGKIIKGFTYSEDGTWKCTSDNSVSLAVIIPPLTETFVTNAWYVAMSNMSELGKPYFNAANAGAKAIGEQIYIAVFGQFTLSTGSLFGLSFKSYDGSGLYSGGFNFSYIIDSDDEVTLEFKGTAVGDGGWYATNAKYNYMAFPFGYAKTPRKFKLSTDSKVVPSYIILTDESDETNVIKLSASQVSFPFTK